MAHQSGSMASSRCGFATCASFPNFKKACTSGKTPTDTHRVSSHTLSRSSCRPSKDGRASPCQLMCGCWAAVSPSPGLGDYRAQQQVFKRSLSRHGTTISFGDRHMRVFLLARMQCVNFGRFREEAYPREKGASTEYQP